MPRREIHDALNRGVAELLREMADLVENNEVYAIDFHRDTEYFWQLTGRRVYPELPPARERLTVVVDVERDQSIRS